MACRYIKQAVAVFANKRHRFRWAACQLGVVGRCLNLPILRKEMASLPKTSDETYARILRDILEEYQGFAVKLL